MGTRTVTETAEQKSVLNQKELLVMRASQGNKGALRDLCIMISRRVLFQVKSLMPNHPDVEDVSQEVLIRVCERIGGLKEPKAFEMWLNRITVNETKRHFGRNSRANVIYLYDEPEAAEKEDESFLPQELTLREEESRMLYNFVLALPDRQREAVILHYYRHLSVSEVADIMCVTDPAIYRYLDIARNKLKQEMLAQAEETGNNRIKTYAFAPLGPALTQMFLMEEKRTEADGKAWADKAFSRIGIRVIAPKASARSGMKGVLAPIIAIFVSVPLLMGGLVFTGVIGNGSTGADKTAAVSFSGGDVGFEHLNPQSATVEYTAQGGDVAVLGWEITDADSGAALYGGTDELVKEPFSLLPDGEYNLLFRLEDSDGKTMSAASNFQILRIK